MVGYPIVLLLLEKLLKVDETFEIGVYEPTVTIMVAAHNEEKVIWDKLSNLLNVEYPTDKLEILVTSDYSTDNTNLLVRKFIKQNTNRKIKLYEVIEHKGKTNAQNEAQELVDSEILMMTDANAMLEKNAVKELVAAFTKSDINYVTGKLQYVNSSEKKTAEMESIYWRIDLKCREIESKIQTITAGNGAIYACRNKEYIDIKPIEGHDSSMPLMYALQKKRAVYNKNAIAYEKAGEVDSDEFKRKVRMNRGLIKGILPDVRILNIFKYKWFSFFYFGHRTCRDLLWLTHALAFMGNIILVTYDKLYLVLFVGQFMFYGIALLRKACIIKWKLAHIIYFYCMTIMAQWYGVFRIMMRKTKPVWDKAESTR